MEVNEYKASELNLASKAILEKLQQLAAEKAKLEEAIRIQKERDELFKQKHQQLSPRLAEQKITVFDNISNQSNVQEYAQNSRNYNDQKISQSDVIPKKCIGLRKSNIIPGQPPMTYGKFKENYQSFQSSSRGSKRQSFGKPAKLKEEPKLKQEEQQSRENLHKIKPRNSSVVQKSNCLMQKKHEQSTKGKHFIQQVAAEQKIQIKSICEINRDGKILQKSQGSTTHLKKENLKQIVTPLKGSFSQFDNHALRTQDSTTPMNIKKNVVVYSKVVANKRSSSKKISYNLKLKEMADQEVSKQVQTIQKFERDSKTRRESRSRQSIQVTQRDKPDDEGILITNQINMSRCQNLTTSNTTTARKNRRSFQTAIQSENKLKIKIIDRRQKDEQKEIWTSICDQKKENNDNEDMGRNLIDQFQTVEQSNPNELSPDNLRTGRSNLNYRRPPSLQVKKPKVQTHQHNSSISNALQFSSLNYDKQHNYSSKTKKLQIEYNDDTSNRSQYNLTPFSLGNHQDMTQSSYMSPTNKDKSSLHRSTMSITTQNSQFKARTYKESQPFVVKKSTKELTIPENFNLSTDKRAQERSLSKNSRLNTIDKQGGVDIIKPDIKLREKIEINRSHETKTEEQSLLDQLIKEYDLEGAYKFAKEQMDKISFEQTFNNNEDYIPKQ